MSIAITGIGTASPLFKRQQLETADLICRALKLPKLEQRLLKSIYKTTGVNYRHSVLSDYCKEPGEFEFFPNNTDQPFPTTAARMKIYKDNALSLALRAIDDCLADISDFHVPRITHLITVSCTGMYAPGLDIEIAQQLNLKSTTKRTAINFMGCYGVFNALKVAEAICNADPQAIVLIVSVEICTIHFQNKFQLDNLLSNALFADGAGALLIQNQAKPKKYFEVTGFHCDLLPQTSDQMAWHIGDNGFDIVLSSYVPDSIQSGIGQFCQNLLQHHATEIDLYGIHPGGLKILEAVEKALHITKNDNRFSYDVLQNYGNMSSATIIFVLKAIWANLTADDHGKTVFSCAFGPGLTLESMLLKTHFIPELDKRSADQILGYDSYGLPK